MARRIRWILPVLAACAVAAVTAASSSATSRAPGGTATPIKHVVVIFGENISFDHYFGTYPNATNPAGESPFTAAPGTPSDVNNYTLHPNLLTANPNSGQPHRFDPKTTSNLVTCDFNHGYTAEQNAFNGGLMNKFPESTSNGCGDVNQEM